MVVVVLPGQVFSMAWYQVRHLNPPEQADRLIDVIQPPPVHLVSDIQAEAPQLVEVVPRMAGTQGPLWVTFLRPQLPEPIPNEEDREDVGLEGLGPVFCHLPPEESTRNEERRTEICLTEIPRFQVKLVDLRVLDSCRLPPPEDRTRNVVDPPEVRTLAEPPSSQVKPEALLPGTFLPGTFLPGTFLPGTFFPETFRRPLRRTPLLDVSAAQVCP